jgi:3-hydroxybutyrate dehydrogenase
MRLKNRVAIVTGAASGIGQEIARTFAREGAQVAIVDIDAEGAHRAAAQILQEGGQAMAVTRDVTHEGQVNEGIAKVAVAYGRIDVLVSNAGIQVVAPLEQLTLSSWKNLLATHRRTWSRHGVQRRTQARCGVR